MVNPKSGSPQKKRDLAKSGAKHVGPESQPGREQRSPERDLSGRDHGEILGREPSLSAAIDAESLRLLKC
jgi:hypothetical protein